MSEPTHRRPHRTLRTSLALSTALAVIFTTAAGSATGSPITSSPWSFDDVRGWWALGGLNLGASIDDGRLGALVGGELSAAYMGLGLPELWAGLYLDGLYDARTQGGRFSLGPELGWAWFGLDAGVVLDDGAVGWRARLLGTTGLACLYVGALQSGDADGAVVFEVGLMAKIPFPL